MSGTSHFSPPQFTLREVVQNLIGWVRFFVSQWKLLLLAAGIGTGLGALVSQVKDPVFHAETSFVLEEEGMGGLGQMSGIANLLGGTTSWSCIALTACWKKRYLVPLTKINC
jgi:hypothetical protein